MSEYTEEAVFNGLFFMPNALTLPPKDCIQLSVKIYLYVFLALFGEILWTLQNVK